MPVISWWQAQQFLLVLNSSTSQTWHTAPNARLREEVGVASLPLPQQANFASPYATRVSAFNLLFDLGPAMLLHMLAMARCFFL